MVEPIHGAMEPRTLHPDHGSGEAGIETVMDEIDEAQPQDATAETRVPSGITRLGVEARAEYIRTRQRLGLSDGPLERLGTVGRYRLEAVLGRGGMGIVFRASDPDLDRPVAIKLVQAVPFARYDKLSTRLLREAKVLAKLTHPNVVRVYDCGQHEGEVYLAMELVEGATLRDWQQGKGRRSILDAYQQAARGLAAAHDLGITHRDFKPDNVLVASDGRVLVGDFGLAGVVAGDELRTEGSFPDGSPGERVSATRTGDLLGTPMYMAPEQLRGKAATSLSDQFAFCVSLWEALTGMRPFEGEKREELLEQIERGRMRGSERLPRRLRGLLLRGLAVEPTARFERLQELAVALGPPRGRVVAALSVSLAVTLGVVAWLSMREPPCDLDDVVQRVEAMPAWGRLQEGLEDARLAPSYDRLRTLFEEMSEEASAVCRPTDDEQARRRDRVEMRLKYLGALVESPVIEDPAMLPDEIVILEQWPAPPPRPVDPDVKDSLHESDVHRLNNHLDRALQSIDDVVAAAGESDLELAFAYQRRGRVLAPLGRYGEAMDAFLEAEGRADAASYDDARLESELLAAEIAAMRINDLDRARQSLDNVSRLLRRLQEPSLSLRRASYHEIWAAVLKRENNFDDALIHQKQAIFMRGWWRDAVEVAMGYINLGTIYELRLHDHDLVLARECYENALQALAEQRSSPEWFEAAFNVGHWLVVYGEDSDWQTAEDLLNQVRAGSNDAAPSALTDLVLLEIQRENAAAAMSRARELEAMLNEDAGSNAPSILPERGFGAWLTVANAHSLAKDLPGFEAARATVERIAQDAIAHDSLPADEVRLQVRALDLTAAEHLKQAAPERALALATSVREYLAPLPEESRTPGMLEATDTLIAELRTSMSPENSP